MNTNTDSVSQSERARPLSVILRLTQTNHVAQKIKQGQRAAPA